MYPRSIYMITHLPTGRKYIGSSHNVEARIKKHLYALRKGTHPVEDMQADYDRFGEKYSYAIIGKINDKSEDHKEYDCMMEFHSHLQSQGYNYKDMRRPRISTEEELLDMVRSSANPALTTKLATVMCTILLLKQEVEDLTKMILVPGLCDGRGGD